MTYIKNAGKYSHEDWVRMVKAVGGKFNSKYKLWYVSDDVLKLIDDTFGKSFYYKTEPDDDNVDYMLDMVTDALDDTIRKVRDEFSVESYMDQYDKWMESKFTYSLDDRLKNYPEWSKKVQWHCDNCGYSWEGGVTFECPRCGAYPDKNGKLKYKT